MNPRTTGILALIALALGGFVWFYEIEGAAEREAEVSSESQVFAGVDAAEIDAIELTTLDGIDARFERRAGRWWLVAPLEARADATALDAMTSALANLPVEGRVEGERELTGFELGRDPRAPGAARRLVRFEISGTARGLRIGHTTPVGGHRYVAPLAHDAVAYVASYRVNAFERNLADLRDRSLFTFAAADVERLVVARPPSAFEVTLEREGGADWRIVAPFEAEADPAMLRDLVSNLAHLRARDFVDDPEAIDPTLRAETAVSIAWTLAGEDRARRARIAGATGGGRLFETPDGRWALVAEERLDDFPGEVDAYRFKRLADFDLAAARRLEFHFVTAAADRTDVLDIVATLEETGWRSPDRPLDPDRTTRLVRDLSQLEAASILADEMGDTELAALGLSPPRGRLRVEGSVDLDGPVETLADLRFGRFDTRRGLFVQRADRPTVFVIDPAVAEGLPYSADHYRFAFEIEGEAPKANAAAAADVAVESDPLEGVPAP